MTQPSLDTAPSGEAADAVRTLQAELSTDYSEIRSAEIQLTEAILGAHAVTVAGRTRLQHVQRQLIEAITNPAMALGTPAGERQFLLFLRGKIAEIQAIVDTGALTDEDHARLTRALGSGYLVPGSEPDDDHAPSTAPAGTSMADQAAGMVPAVGSALGALPQAAQGAAAAPAQGASGLAGAAAPLAGLASGRAEHGDDTRPSDHRDEPSAPLPDDPTDVDDEADHKADDDDKDDDVADDTDDRRAEPRPPSDRQPATDGPAQTRPARLL
ncbi:hypothetical protein A5662_14855 [Mycobacteriaceae bacterium 1482268.1]|nr:hypothetical protein A5662_14855 [Mycobacteriaceae bacterium 1482268.1]